MNPGHIVIVGGGAAGWMSACLMAHRWRASDLSVTVVESKTIGTVGVGEGSTPFLRDFFAQLGIAEGVWMPACGATYKCGIRFSGWSERPGFDSYFHPFNTELDQPGAVQFFKDCYARRMGYQLHPVPDAYFAASAIAQSGRTPFALMSDGTAKPLTDYGYHFDSHLLGEFLQQHAKSLGVIHVDDRVVDVERGVNGDIVSLRLEQNASIYGDFFIDCSGFKSLLMRETLGVPFISCRDRLVNNAAVALPSLHRSTEQEYPVSQGASGAKAVYPTETLAQAMPNGWMWRIPLTQRWGNGYVFNSDDTSFDDIEHQLRTHLGEGAETFSARRLSWQPGRLQRHWENNCIAVGLSQGFLEPLEAPMLRIIQFSCEQFIELYDREGPTAAARNEFSRVVNRLIDGNIDYLQAHYLVSARTDTDYWRAARANINLSPVLQRLLSAWRGQGSFDAALSEVSDSLVYHKTSWYCLLAGKGEFAEASRSVPAVAQITQRRFKEHNARLARQCVWAVAG